MSAMSIRVTQSVEAAGRLQSVAAQYAAAVTARRAETATRVAGVGEVELMCAWLAGYEARQRIALADAKAELAAAESLGAPPPQHPHTQGKR